MTNATMCKQSAHWLVRSEHFTGDHPLTKVHRSIPRPCDQAARLRRAAKADHIPAALLFAGPMTSISAFCHRAGYGMSTMQTAFRGDAQRRRVRWVPTSWGERHTLLLLVSPQVLLLRRSMASPVRCERVEESLVSPITHVPEGTYSDNYSLNTLSAQSEFAISVYGSRLEGGIDHSRSRQILGYGNI